MAVPSPTSEADAPAAAGGGDAAGFDAAAALNALRERGAHRADPVRFRFIEALARRAEGQPEAVRRLLDAKLARALDEYLAHYQSGHAGEAPSPVVPAASAAPTAAASATGLAAPVPSAAPAAPAPNATPAAPASPASPAAGPLGELVRSLARTPPLPGPDAAKRGPAPTPELQALRYFRHTWAKLAVHRSLNQSIAKTPKNAGPLNSHRLVLRSLEVMREVSPDYLNRFVSYVDALLVLDGMGNPAPAPVPAPAPPEGEKTEKKRKAARGAGTPGRG